MEWFGGEEKCASEGWSSKQVPAVAGPLATEVACCAGSHADDFISRIAGRRCGAHYIEVEQLPQG
jgi:hypothetical protein